MRGQSTFPSLAQKATTFTAKQLTVIAFLCTAMLGSFAEAQAPPVTTAPKPTENLRAIPDDNLAYPVLVIIGNTTGSGFYLNTEKATFLVTAKHVLFDPVTKQLNAPSATLISYSRDLADTTKNIIKLDLTVLQADKDLVSRPSVDVVVVKVFDAGDSTPKGRLITTRAGVTVASFAALGVLGVDSKAVKRFDQVLTGNDVMVFGYPTSLGLLRKGIVAGTNPATKFLVLDCPVYFGNSGGPVLELDRQSFGTKLSIIGVVDQYVPFVQQAGSQTIAMQVQTNSGYSLAIPMDSVLELAK